MLYTAQKYSHQLLEDILDNGDYVVDATSGNGYDTIFLAEQIGATGTVFAFDIQEAAIQSTATNLQKNHLESRVNLIHASHDQINSYIPENLLIKAAIFNLGYLPQSDKKIITQPQTTLRAVKLLQERLLPKGRIVIVAYYGHPGGKNELEELENYLSEQNQQEWSVLRHQFMNQKNNPPICFCIEKK